MTVARIKPIVSSTVALAALVHVLWGAALLIFPEARGSSATAAITRFCGAADVAGAVLLVAGLTGFIGLGAKRIASLAWAIPQQAILVLNAWSVVDSASRGAYPDGTPKPALFILTDQLPAIALALFHLAALAVLVPHRRRQP